MTQYTNLTTNHEPEPYTPSVGDGATTHGWSDAHAYTIIAVSKSGRTITMQRDRATLLNGFRSGEPDALVAYPGGFCAHVEGDQRYTYERDPEGGIVKATLRTRRNGTRVWKLVGIATRERGGEVTVGERAEFYDYNF